MDKLGDGMGERVRGLGDQLDNPTDKMDEFGDRMGERVLGKHTGTAKNILLYHA